MTTTAPVRLVLEESHRAALHALAAQLEQSGQHQRAAEILLLCSSVTQWIVLKLEDRVGVNIPQYFDWNAVGRVQAYLKYAPGLPAVHLHRCLDFCQAVWDALSAARWPR